MTRLLPPRLFAFSLLLLVLSVANGKSQEFKDSYLEAFKWRALGPSATGGRIVDIAVHPDNPHMIYAAAASGGLWKTTNNGTTWKCVFENEGTISIGDIAVDPRNPDTIWVGTGEANNQRSSYWGDGVYKSTDGGKTWENVGLRDTHHIGRIVVDPTNSDIVYVAALGHLYTFNEERGLFKTTDGGKTWKKVLYVNKKVGVVDVVLDPEQPDTIYAASYERLRRAWHFDGAGPGSAIYKSSDGGKNWRKLTGGLPSGEIGRIGLAIYPPNPKILYATLSNQNTVKPKKGKKSPGLTLTTLGIKVKFEKNRCIITSVSFRGLARRFNVKKGEVLVRVGGKRIASKADMEAAFKMIRNGDVANLLVAAGKSERLVPVRLSRAGGRQVGGEIYRTDNGGRTWTKQNSKPVGGSPAYYYGQIRIDPKDDKRLYVMSVPLYVSSDGGKKWSSAGARSVHVDHHAMWINPRNTNHILLGNDGGFHISYDRAKTWDHVYNLPLAQFYAIGADMRKPYFVYGGTQDNGTYGGPSRSRNPSGISRFEWHKVGGGDGFYVQIDPKDHNIVFLESQFGVLRRLHLAKGTSTSIRPPQSEPKGPRDRYNWNSPILMSRFDSRVIYFAGNKLFKSYNRGDNWQVISPDLTTANPEKIKGNVPHCTITTVAESPKKRNMLLVGTDDGNVQWTNDGGKTWTNMSDRFPIKPKSWWCSRVEMSHHDENVAYASFTCYREDDFRQFVFATRDKGKSWQSIAGNLSSMSRPVGPINVIKEDPVNRNVLYVGSEFGVYVSVNGGKGWMPLDKNLPRVAVHDLLIHPRDKELVIGTHGRGMYVMDITPLQELTEMVLKSDARLCTVKNAIRWRRLVRQGISGDRKLYTPNPTPGAPIWYYLGRNVEKKDISLRILDKNGKRIASLKPATSAGLHRVHWNMRRTGSGRRPPRGPRRPRFTATVPPGIYTVVLKVGEAEHRRTMVVEPDPLDVEK